MNQLTGMHPKCTSVLYCMHIWRAPHSYASTVAWSECKQRAVRLERPQGLQRAEVSTRLQHMWHLRLELYGAACFALTSDSTNAVLAMDRQWPPVASALSELWHALSSLEEISWQLVTSWC